ncbi:hypothetical protein FNV43_RR16960 [Rhamnella rubrinervis]|uniref:Uncharacterized protein n=1 Tax=Rhamnella rubrinervis TaxID=2594499 RepID=A0A8K0GZR1_9ROSA|nr:hypothetical protein FNV43_RR16960 [Rhamnella rubrinervis]
MNNGINQRLLSSIRRQLHLHLQFQNKMCLLHHHCNQPCYGPTEALKRKIKELQKNKKGNNIKRAQQFLVDVPESNSYLDTATMPMILTAVGIALFAKLLMMYDESKSQEMIENKIRDAPSDQGTVRMLTREEWEKIREVRPRTPFESKLARPNAKIRTGEPLRMDL